jgi:hypothetical protein
MDILADRIGIILKHGKIMGGLTKRYFFIDNKGNMLYTDKESIIQELLKNKIYDDQKFISLFTSKEKIIKIPNCSASSIKPFLENKFDLQGRSFFELYDKDHNFRNIIVFAWKEEYTSLLHLYVKSFEEIKNDFEEKEFQNFTESNMLKGENNNFTRLISLESAGENNLFEKNEKQATKNIFSNAKNKKFMEKVLKKLEGKFVNQNGWEKDKIKILNPTSDLEEYEEVWVELENGSNYSGQVKNGMPHGYGKEYRTDGSLYAGYFYEGKWQGVGTITTETLDTYHGEFIDGCICGI